MTDRLTLPDLFLMALASPYTPCNTRRQTHSECVPVPDAFYQHLSFLPSAWAEGTDYIQLASNPFHGSNCKVADARG